MSYLFRRKPINELRQTLLLLDGVSGILRRHHKTKSFRPTEEDFDTLKDLADYINELSIETVYITRDLKQRACGEPEGSP